MANDVYRSRIWTTLIYVKSDTQWEVKGCRTWLLEPDSVYFLSDCCRIGKRKVCTHISQFVDKPVDFSPERGVGVKTGVKGVAAGVSKEESVLPLESGTGSSAWIGAGRGKLKSMSCLPPYRGAWGLLAMYSCSLKNFNLFSDLHSQAMQGSWAAW